LWQLVEEVVHGADDLGFIGIEDVVIGVGQTDHLSCGDTYCEGVGHVGASLEVGCYRCGVADAKLHPMERFGTVGPHVVLSLLSEGSAESLIEPLDEQFLTSGGRVAPGNSTPRLSQNRA
jgi:hypothetical protein